MSSRIEEFTGSYRFLSNFYPAEVELDGSYYPTVEHAYQAAKTTDHDVRAFIRKLKRPGEAKRYGRNKVELRPGWDAMKLEVMHELVLGKFAVEPLAGKLLATRDKELIEGNYWHDLYWGICNGGCKFQCGGGRGENHLGEILMRVRKEIA